MILCLSFSSPSVKSSQSCSSETPCQLAMFPSLLRFMVLIPTSFLASFIAGDIMVCGEVYDYVIFYMHLYHNMKNMWFTLLLFVCHCVCVRAEKIMCDCIWDCVYTYVYLCWCESVWIDVVGHQNVCKCLALWHVGTWQSWDTQIERGKRYLELISMYPPLMSCSLHSQFTVSASFVLRLQTKSQIPVFQRTLFHHV